MFSSQSRSNAYEWHTSVAADFAIWRCASSLALPGGDIALEFTFISMPTRLAVTVSTVTLSVAFTQNEFYTVRKKATLKAELTFYHFVIIFVFWNNIPAPQSLLKIIKLGSLPPKHYSCANTYTIIYIKQVTVSSNLS